MHGVQVGNPALDSVWTRPEDARQARPVYALSPSLPGGQSNMHVHAMPWSLKCFYFVRHDKVCWSIQQRG